MIYYILADIVAAIHFSYVAYVVVGEVLIVAGIPLRWQWIRNSWFRVTHLAMIVVVALESFASFECPLTTWEKQLNALAGVSWDERSFVGRLLDDWLFIELPEWSWPWVYGSVAALILLTFFIAPPRCVSRRSPLGRERIPVHHAP